MIGERQWPLLGGQLGISHSASLSSCLNPADQLAASLGEKYRKPWLPSFPPEGRDYSQSALLALVKGCL